MKKFFAFCLLLISVAGTIFPCCEVDDCTVELVSAESHEDQEEGVCSPFITCGTCAGFTQLVQTPEIPGIFLNTTTHPIAVMDPPRSVYTASLFQPPRFAWLFF